MVKTRKQSKGIYSIPELRRLFEHIEKYVDDKIGTKENVVKSLKKEWKKVFLKKLETSSAKAFVDNRMRFKRRRRTLRNTKGGSLQASSLQGAPLDYTLRQGMYLSPGQIPDGVFGNYTEYVSKGFFNPEPARSYDPVVGQQRFPIVAGGSRRRLRKGGAFSSITGMLQRPFVPTEPTNPVQDIYSRWYGVNSGISSNLVNNRVSYDFNNIYPKVVT